MLIAQITDLHAGEPADDTRRLPATLDGVRRAVRHLNALRPRPGRAPPAFCTAPDLVPVIPHGSAPPSPP